MAKRLLEINVTAAEDLEDVRLLGQMKVYTIVSISTKNNSNMSNEAQRTPVDMKGETNPTWNFGMKFILDETATEVVFELKCQRTELGDKHVGALRIPVAELLARAGNQRFWEVVEYQVMGPYGRPKGLLKFSYRFGESSSSTYGLPFIWPPLKPDLIKSTLRVLELNIGSARDLEDVRFLGRMKVYALVSISTNPNSTQRTHADIKGETNPSWNFNMAFVVSTEATLTDPVLLIELKCQRTDGDKPVGEVRVPMSDLLNRAQLSPQTFASTNYKVMCLRKSQKGLLSMSYRFRDMGSVAVMEQQCVGGSLVIGQPSMVGPAGHLMDGGDVASVVVSSVVSSVAENAISGVIENIFG